MTALTPRPVVALLISGLLVSAPTAATAASGSGLSSYKLEAHETSVDYGTDVRMWSCWDRGDAPILYAWTGDSWSRWAVGVVKGPDLDKCRRGDHKIIFNFHVSQKGRHIANRPYNLLKVKETCRECEPAKWTLPVVV
jgi:hypothetical protein